MDKDKIFESLKNLILTLKSPNFNNPSVRGKWIKLKDEVLEAVKNLSEEDIKDLTLKYELWYSEEVKLKLDEKQSIIAEGLSIFSHSG
ncbi:MAG: hypothetical protein WC119_00615 [Synergistaceae bacterium]